MPFYGFLVGIERYDSDPIELTKIAAWIQSRLASPNHVNVEVQSLGMEEDSESTSPEQVSGYAESLVRERPHDIELCCGASLLVERQERMKQAQRTGDDTI